jgi:hypothetical protein
LNIAREALRRGVSGCDVYVGVIAAAMKEIGALWERNGITVAHEHIASAVVQAVIVQLHLELPMPRIIVGGRVFDALNRPEDIGADEHVKDLRMALRLFSPESMSAS